MAKPGVVLRRPVGSSGPFGEHAELPTNLGDTGKSVKAARKSKGSKPTTTSSRLIGGRTTRIGSPGSTSPPCNTIAITPLKIAPDVLSRSRSFGPGLKRSMRTQGVRSPVSRIFAELPIRSTVSRGSFSRSRPAVVMFSPRSPGLCVRGQGQSSATPVQIEVQPICFHLLPRAPSRFHD
jgi:hypothetical protein